MIHSRTERPRAVQRAGGQAPQSFGGAPCTVYRKSLSQPHAVGYEIIPRIFTRRIDARLSRSPRRINKVDGITVGEGIEIGGGGMPEGIGGNKTGGFGVVVTGPHVDEAGGIGAVTAPGMSRGDRPAGFDGLWRVEVLTVGVVIPVVPYGGLAARREGGEDMAEGIVNQAGGVGALPQGDQAPDTVETTVNMKLLFAFPLK